MGGYVTKVDMTKAFRGAVEWLKNAYESAYYVEKGIRDGEPISNVKLFEAIRAERVFLEAFAANRSILDADVIVLAREIQSLIAPGVPLGQEGKLIETLHYGPALFQKVIARANDILNAKSAPLGRTKSGELLELPKGPLHIAKGLVQHFVAWRSGAKESRVVVRGGRSNSVSLAHRLKRLLIRGESLGLDVDWQRRCPIGSIERPECIMFGRRVDRDRKKML